MKQIRILINDKLRLRTEDLPAEAVDAIVEALSIPNVAREKAKKMDQWGWDQMPAKIRLYTREDGVLVMPRGFLADLAMRLESFGYQIDLKECRH